MPRKISQINFSFIQHLYVGDGLYDTDYKQSSSGVEGRRSNAWTTTFTCKLYIHGSFTNTPRECSWVVFHKKPQI